MEEEGGYLLRDRNMMNMRDNTKMIKRMAMEYTNGQMVQNMRVILRMI